MTAKKNDKQASDRTQDSDPSLAPALAVRLQNFRKSKGWSQTKLAKQLGVNQQQVSIMEKTGDIPSRCLARLRSCGLNVDSFLDEDPDAFAEGNEPFFRTLELFKNLYRGGFEEVYPKRAPALERFATYIRREKEMICTTGSSLRGLTVNRDIWNSIVERARTEDELKVRFLLTHPAFAVLRAFVEGRGSENIKGEITEAIETYYADLKKVGDDRVDAHVALHPPTIFAIFLVGQQKALVNPYTLTTEAYSTTTFIVRDTGDEDCLFRQYKKHHFDEAWELTKHPGRVSIPLSEYDKQQGDKYGLYEATRKIGEALQKIANPTENSQSEE